MGRKIIKVCAALEFVVSLVAFVAIYVCFKNNAAIFDRLEDASGLSTFLRMMVYVIPGIYFLGSMYAAVFSTRNVLIVMGTIQFVTSLFLLLIDPSLTIYGLSFACVEALYIYGATKLEKEKTR